MTKPKLKIDKTRVVGPTREWVTIPVAGKSREQYQVDVTYLTSNYRCVFGDGCCGVLTEPTPELSQGCCSYGAHADDEQDMRRTEKMAKLLHADEWQFKEQGTKRGVWKKAGKNEWSTRLVGDACIFLNRPDFAAGPGCALHLLALRKEVHFAETKPTVCWQLPLRKIEREEEDGSTTHVITEFARSGWGDGGDEFGWWCTEAPEAFSGSEPLYKSMEAELRAMMGDAVYESVASYLTERMQTGRTLPHPASVPVKLGRTRHREAI